MGGNNVQQSEATPMLYWWDVCNSASGPEDHELPDDLDNDLLPKYDPVANINRGQRRVKKLNIS